MAERPSSNENGTPRRDALGQAKLSGQQPLSCTNCRQRKVKCNKTHPCLPCQRSDFECVFPERAKHPKRKKTASKTSTQELLDRLSRMEQLIGGIEGEEKAVSPEPKQTTTPSSLPRDSSSRKSSLKDVGFGDKEREGSASPSDGLNRYIGVGFWRTLTCEVDGLRQAIDEEGDEDDESSPYSTSDSHNSHSSIMFGSAYHTPQNLRPLHPLPIDITSMCEVYITNVDPCAKFLHNPTMRNFITNVVSNIDNIPTDNYVEPMLFAIYYAAITTLTNEQCLSRFQDSQNSLLTRFRAGFERALANADFLNTTEIGVLQALAIFLLCVRTNDDSQFGWTLLATLVRLAHGIGLHKESSSHGMSPFAVEMRRRLWWQIIVLDIRNCEDRASEPIISPTSFNTRKPLNINDDDISPDMESLPSERIGFTEMSKSNISHEVSYLRWKFADTIPHYDESGIEAPLLVSDRLKAITDIEQWLNERVIKYCDPAVPIAWVTIVVARLIMCRLRLILYHPIEHTSESKANSFHVSNEKLLETAVACMEYSHLLDAEPKCAHWRWFFKTYVQWHALATTLAELCMQTKGPLVERAWRIVDTVFDDWAARIADSPNGMLWRPMKKLMAKAQARRLQTQQLDQQLKLNVQQSQQPLPRFETLSFEPNSTSAPALTPRETVMNYGVACMPPFDGSETNISGIHNGAVGMGAPLDTSMGSLSVSGEQLYGLTPELQDLSSIAIRSSTGYEGTGEINWAEWDEFMSGFDVEAQPPAKKDVDMMGAGMPPPQIKGVDVWW